MIHQLELDRFHRVVQVGLEPVPVLHRGVHRGLEQLPARLARALRRVEREVGVLEQLLAVAPGVDGGRDADARVGQHLLAGDDERLAERLDDALGDAHRGRRLIDADEQDGELVTAQPRGDIAGAEALADAVGDGAQQLVTRGMAEAVVDGLEVIDVDEEHADVLPRLRQRLLDAGAEEEPVRHAGQRIV